MGLIFPSQDPSGTWQQGLLAYRWFKSCLSQSPSARSTLGQCQKCDYCKIHKHRPRQSPPLAAGDSPAPRRLPSARLCPLGGAALGYEAPAALATPAVPPRGAGRRCTSYQQFGGTRGRAALLLHQRRDGRGACTKK